MPDPELEVEGNFEILGGVSAAEQFLDLPEPPTAIFSFNDNMAIGACRPRAPAAFRIPEDLSIVGFDDLEEAAIVTPALTTGSPATRRDGPDRRQFADAGARQSAPRALHVELGTRLIVRDSTAPPR